MSVRVPAAAVTASLLALLSTAAAPAEPLAKSPSPGAPTNLRITATTSSSATLAWDVPKGGNVSYYGVLNTATWTHFTLPGTQTTFTQTRLWPQVTHAWVVYAVDSRGRTSDDSNKVTYTTPADTTAPSAPTLAATFVGPTRVLLDWTDSVDDVSNVRYRIEIDGTPWATVDASEQTVIGLSPSTTYAFTVAASDQWGNTTQSNPVTVTTPAATNTSPPTAPPNLFGGESFGCEVSLSWAASSDDVDPPEAIVYTVYRNGEFVTSLIGYTATVDYGTAGENTYTVVASDSSGNEAASSITLQLTTC